MNYCARTLLHVDDKVRKRHPKARLLKDARRGAVHLPVQEVVRTVRHGRLLPGGGRGGGRGAAQGEVVEPAPAVFGEFDRECRIVHFAELGPVVEGVLVPDAGVLAHVEAVH